MSTAQRPACEQQVPSAEPPDPGASPRRRPAVRPGRSRAGGEAESSSGAPRRSPLSAGSGCAVAQEPSPRGPLGYRCLCRGRSQPLHAARGRPGRAGPGWLLGAHWPGSAGWRAEAGRKVPCLCVRGRVCSRSEIGNSCTPDMLEARRCGAMPLWNVCVPCAVLERFAGSD